MISLILAVTCICIIIFWLYKVNQEFYILSFFARRVQTWNGQSVESIAPTRKGRTIFGNSFDLIGVDDVSMFKLERQMALEMGKNYLLYGCNAAYYKIIDPIGAEMILNNPNLTSKGILYEFFHSALNTGVFTSSGKKWELRRQMITPTFSVNILKQFEKVFNAESEKFVKQFEQDEEIIISLNDVIPRFTLNTICETSMGVSLDDMAEKGDRYRSSIQMIDKCFFHRLGNPLYWCHKIYNIFGAHKYASDLRVIHDFSSEIIAKRRILLEDVLQQRRITQTADDDMYVIKNERFAMLDTLICAEKDGLIDHEGICEEVNTLIFEGFDSSSRALIFALLNLSLYADMQERCYQEIIEHTNDDLSKLDGYQLNQLKYLDCFIKESLRLFPPIPSIIRKTVNKVSLPNGLVLPKNCQIMIKIFDIQRNPKYWHKADNFNPDRFLPENFLKQHPFAYLPFSGGQRNCFGQKYAMQSVKTLIVAILRNFEIKPLINPKDIAFSAGVYISVKNTIKVKLVKRIR